MSFHHRLFSYPPHLMVESADFDGTNDYMTLATGLTGATDSKTGILSCWARIDGGDGATRYIVIGQTTGGSNDWWQFRLQADNTFFFRCTDNHSGADIISLGTSNAYLAGSSWIHVLASWNLSTPVMNLYVNDASDKASGTLTNDTLDYTQDNWTVGAQNNVGSNKFNGCLAELYFAPGQYLDFSVTNNRRKFITSSLKPVYLGADGAGPTGTAPLIYFHLDPSETVANFATNRGTGGDFTITGALAAGSTSPSDF